MTHEVETTHTNSASQSTLSSYQAKATALHVQSRKILSLVPKAIAFEARD